MTVSSDKTRLICPLTAEDPEAMRQEMLEAAAMGADCVECRLDLLSVPPTGAELHHLLANHPVETIVTHRPQDQGGRFAGTPSERLRILRQAAALADLADVEMHTPPGEWPQGPAILSYHDFAAVPANVKALAAELDASPAAVNKIAFKASGPEDALLALDLVRECRKPTIALAMGEAGVASRILARKFGAFGTFATLHRGRETAPGQPTIEELRDLYHWDRMNASTAVYGVIGCPIGHSMSPAIHNTAFEAIHLNAVYVPLRIESGAENFNRFMDALRQRPWLDCRGLSVTIPHKESALAYIGAANCDDLSVQIGAVNTITLLPDGTLRGDNTDYAASMDALCSAMLIRRSDLSGQKVAVLGAGGVARAIVAGLKHYGAQVTIYNRTPQRGEKLAGDFACRNLPLDQAARMDSQIVINCTPIGMHPQVDASPLPEIPPSVKVVFDTIYNPIETLLLRTASAIGCQTVSGLDMFVNQAVGQFEIWTGRAAPREVMRHVVTERLKGALH